jgi:UDP-glucose 4-epimerase
MVTGTSGLIGGAIALHLCGQGHEVVGLSRRKSPFLPARITQLETDIASPSFLEKVRNEAPPCEAIVHAAADRNPAIGAASVSTTNCLGTQQIIALAQSWPTVSRSTTTRAFLFLSGLSVVGVPKEHPITEEHPAQPLSAYLASKLFGEHLVNIACRAGLQGASFRVTAPIGPDMPRDRIVSVFIQRALNGQPIVLNGAGTRRQDYVDVRDIACATEQWLMHPAEGVFNIASGRPISNLELAKLCTGVLNSTSRIEFSGKPDPDDAIAWDVSIEKAKRAFGYEPTVTIEDSILQIAAALKGA